MIYWNCYNPGIQTLSTIAASPAPSLHANPGAATRVMRWWGASDYFPSTLSKYYKYGNDMKGEPIHVICAFSPTIRVITIYRPDENKWIEYERRK